MLLFLIENTNQESSQLINQLLLTELSPSAFTSKEMTYSLHCDLVLSKVTECVFTAWPDKLKQ